VKQPGLPVNPTCAVPASRRLVQNDAMTKYQSCRAGMVLVVLLGGAACSSQRSSDQKKVDELQAQLDDVKKQLAARDEAPPPAASPAAAEQPPTKPPAASSKAAAPPVSKPVAPAAAPEAPKAPPQYDQDRARVKGALEQQQSVNQQQAQTNQQVQTQIEDLKSREYTMPAGMVIPVRTITELSTSKLANGSVFEALLEKSLVVNGTTIAPEGAHVTGVVVSSDPGGRTKGVASLAVTIRAISGVRDQNIRVKTSTYSVQAETSKGKDAKKTGIMTGVGAAIGAIAGGGKGAAIGAGAGAAAGVGTNLATRGDAAIIPAETVIQFTLAAPSTVVVRQ
jgi:hypothetical protein